MSSTPGPRRPQSFQSHPPGHLLISKRQGACARCGTGVWLGGAVRPQGSARPYGASWVVTAALPVDLSPFLSW